VIHLEDRSICMNLAEQVSVEQAGELASVIPKRLARGDDRP
jgi:hypothetical protein